MTDWKSEYRVLVQNLWRSYRVYSSAGATNAAFDRHVWPVIKDARKTLRASIRSSSSADLLLLAERLQKVENGSLVLDQEIADALGRPTYPFTTSLDAALSLTRRDVYDYQVGDVNGSMGGTPYARVGQHECYGATPVLSLCAASLVALASDPWKIE